MPDSKPLDTSRKIRQAPEDDPRILGSELHSIHGEVLTHVAEGQVLELLRSGCVQRKRLLATHTVTHNPKIRLTHIALYVRKLSNPALLESLGVSRMQQASALA
jgi:hypothetical protein